MLAIVSDRARAAALDGGEDLTRGVLVLDDHAVGDPTRTRAPGGDPADLGLVVEDLHTALVRVGPTPRERTDPDQGCEFDRI